MVEVADGIVDVVVDGTVVVDVDGDGTARPSRPVTARAFIW